MLLSQKPKEIDKKISTDFNSLCSILYTVKIWYSWKVRQPRTIKKTQKYSNAIIFVVLHFTEKQKKWNSVFAIMDIPCNFQRNRPKEMAIILNGLK
jgi:hypothetical protein